MNIARRAGFSALLGPLVDAVAFILLVRAGTHYGLAHILSFALAAVTSALAGRITGAPLAAGMRPLARLGLGLMALLLRGGVLVLLIVRCGLPPALAIFGAILASTLITRRGRTLCAPAADSAGEADRWRALAIGLGLYALLLRLAYLACVDLFPEEAYYWNYAQHLDFGYLDHPPLVAWLIRCGTAVFGNTEFGVRAGAIVCMGGASFFVYRTTREMYGRASALVALVLMQLLPVYMLGGLFMTPDAPLTAAWAACLYFLQRALLGGHPRAWWGAGIALGIGLISKYSIGLVVPAALVFMLIDPPSRRWLWHVMPYAAGLVALAIFSPVIIWNAHHDWASFAFQTSQRLAERPRFSLHKLIGSALILLSPIGFAALPYLLRGGTAGLPAQPATSAERRTRFTRVFTLVPLAVFALFSLRHSVKFDWTGALWVAVVPALGHAIAAPGTSLPGWLRRAWAPTAVVLLLLYGATLHYLTLGPPGVPYTRQMLVLPVAWRDLGTQVGELVAGMRVPGMPEPLVVGMNRYMVAGELAFYSADPVRAAQNTTSQHLFGPSGLMYEQWFPTRLQEGRQLLLVALDAGELAEARLTPYVNSLGPVHAAALRRNGRVISHYFYRTAEGYHSAPVTAPP